MSARTSLNREQWLLLFAGTVSAILVLWIMHMVSAAETSSGDSGTEAQPTNVEMCHICHERPVVIVANGIPTCGICWWFVEIEGGKKYKDR